MGKTLAVLTFFLAASAAGASTVTWEFQNAQLVYAGHGGTITGSFGYDADTGMSSDVNIGNSFGGSYSTVTEINPTTYELGGGNGVSLDMVFATNNALTDAGGTLTFTGGQHNYFGIEPFNGTLIGTPDVAATPEPGTFALLSAGLVGISGVMRRRRV